MKYGLKDEHIGKISEVFKNYPKINKVILIGSRAKGNFRNGSDIDFVLKGNSLKLDDLLSLNVLLDKLNLPYTFDLLVFENIQNADLLEHIERVGIEFFEKK